MAQNPRGQKLENQPSSLLNTAENQRLFSLLGNRCVTLSSAVVQVYLADPPSPSRWNKRCCGIATLVRDSGKKSYYIRVYDLKNGSVVWEQELYSQFEYKTPRPYFHTFEADNSIAGLNFANDTEAATFQNAVNDRLQQRCQRKTARKGQTDANRPRPPAPPGNSGQLASQPVVVQSNLTTTTQTKVSAVSKFSGGKKDKSKKPKGITKEDIGQPTDFRHVSHLGWDPDTGFDLQNLDPALKSLFEQAGLNESQLKDKATANFVYQFIEDHGGVDELKRNQQQRPLPPPPPNTAGGRPGLPAPPAAPSGSRGPVPPPPPGGNRVGPPTVAPPPPPPQGPRGAAAGGGAPPPPPPPGPPPPPLSGPGPLTVTASSSSPPADQEAPGERGALLQQIREGMKLKPVADEEPEERSRASGGGGGGGMAEALRKALEARAGAVQGQDASDEEGSTDIDEWGD